MSNSQPKPKHVVAKDKRRGVIDQTSVHGKKHVKRPYKIFIMLLGHELSVGHYADRADAEKALASYHNKGYASARIVNPGED
jgi:hypothetical protein